MKAERVTPEAESQLSDLFLKADKHLNRGRYQAAFQTFLTAARAGDSSSQLNVGHLYDVGKGVARSRAKALHWYKKAYAKRSAAAAHNIGTIFRDEKRWKRALWWFGRAVQLGDDDSHIEIAKIRLQLGDRRRARLHFQAVLDSDRVTEHSLEEATRLLHSLQGNADPSGK